MERFVMAIVTGGIALVVGLWIASVFSPFATGWLLGIALVLVGIGGLGWGIWTQVSMRRLVGSGET